MCREYVNTQKLITPSKGTHQQCLRKFHDLSHNLCRCRGSIHHNLQEGDRCWKCAPPGKSAPLHRINLVIQIFFVFSAFEQNLQLQNVPIESLNSYFESLNSYFESLNSYFERLNSYFESLNSYFQSLSSYFQSLNSYFETVANIRRKGGGGGGEARGSRTNLCCLGASGTRKHTNI